MISRINQFLICFLFSLSLFSQKNGNPIVPYVGMADPHIFIYNNKAYLYATRDIDSLLTKTKFVMPDWSIWSSDDLVQWKKELVIKPTETYMGESISCWASDMGYRNGKYYFYFSNGNKTTGVMVGNSPVGPFKDALGKPMLEENLTTSKEYDPSVLIDDDKAKKPYIIFGHHRDDDSTLGYYISELNEDMISLKTVPKKIKFTGDNRYLTGNDKPNLHKRNGIYYLSAGSHYATSKNIYGPYTKMGNTGNDKYGLTPQAHGNFFEWKNQWFHTWCKFHLTKEVARYRESYITYLHYKKNGEMVSDTVLLKNHFSNGVGQYDAKWDKVEAEWYMAADKVRKNDFEEGFEIDEISDKGYLYYPNIRNLTENSKLILKIKPLKKGKLIIRSNSIDGKVIGTLIFGSKKSSKYEMDTVMLTNAGGINNLYFTFSGSKKMAAIDWFKFETEPMTKVSIKNNQFLINDKLTYEGRYWNKNKIEGLLLNSRMVQGIFDDLNSANVKEFAYEDSKVWDPNRNTNEFLVGMEEWKKFGLNSFTMNIQGGSPYGYGNKSAFNPGYFPDGSLMPDYMSRLKRILDKADELNMVVILGLFYFGQDQHLQDEKAVINAVNNVTNWLHERKYRNVLIEIANESSHKLPYEHSILKDHRAHELIKLVKNNVKYNYAYPVTTSFIGRGVPTSEVAKVSDYILIHGNGARSPEQVQLLIDSTKMVLNGRNIPIVINEDDHYNFNEDKNNFKTAIENYVSWGYFDFRRKGEGLIEGFQSMPADWGVNSNRKIQFFNKVAEITGTNYSKKITSDLVNSDMILIEAESTKSPLGEWKIIDEDNKKFVKGASSHQYIEFQGNQPDSGSPNSPLEYSFKAPYDGNFRLVMMTNKRLEGVRGDMCNDVWVKMSGDFDTSCKLTKDELKDYNKYFQEGSVKTPENQWNWAFRAEQGTHKFFELIYKLKKGETYTVTLAGRSQRFGVDYLLLYDNDKMTFENIKEKFKTLSN
jgi:arabinoxylan arabinofuranohydrolase